MTDSLMTYGLLLAIFLIGAALLVWALYGAVSVWERVWGNFSGWGGSTDVDDDILYCQEHDEPWIWVGRDGTKICAHWVQVLAEQGGDYCYSKYD